MKVCYLEDRRIDEFIDYCDKYGKEHDGSFLPDKNFRPDGENPTYILLDEAERIIGAASLIINKRYKSNRLGRFRILHTTLRSLEAYTLLHNAVLLYTGGIDNIFLFIQEDRKTDVGRILEQMGYTVQRYAWYLERPCQGSAAPSFTEGYALSPMRWERDEMSWREINGVCFAKHAGHVDLSIEDVKAIRNEEGHLDDGMRILWKGGKPVGTIRVSKELENDAYVLFISHVAVVPEHRQKGLATNMVRWALTYGDRLGVPCAGLSVNAENDRAANIYLKEGFKKVETVICYNMRL